MKKRIIDKKGIKRSFSKYKSKKTSCDGILFHSKKEAERYKALKLLSEAKIIKELGVQPTFEIKVNDVKICNYKADFIYKRDGETIIEDVKGFKTPLYRLKKKLVEALYPFKIKEV